MNFIVPILAFVPFSAPMFFWVGAACALGPILIHLLNRRQFREIHWAAMDFLREAIQRNRRMIELRDIVILILRTAAILLIGAAIAQPFLPEGSNVAWNAVLLLGVGAGLAAIFGAALWMETWLRWLAFAIAAVLAGLAATIVVSQQGQTAQEQLADSGQPVHAILVVDNSLSMGLQGHGGSLLAEAKKRAKEVVGRLPLDSRISVVPLCGSAHGYSLDPYRTAAEANLAIDRIEVVDRAGDFRGAVNLALEASKGSDLGKRIIFFGDQQLRNWRGVNRPEELADLPNVQVVSITPPTAEPSNTWVADFRLDDAIADTQSEARLVVDLGHQGSEVRENVQVTVAIVGRTPDEDLEIGSQTITLKPASSETSSGRQLVFTHLFDEVQPEAGQMAFVPLRVSVTQDGLPDDDERYLVAPVVSALPVVFIDQYTDTQERSNKSLHGDTFRLRQLLAPRGRQDDPTRQVFRIVHLRPDEVDQQVLEEARLVVLGGVDDPGSLVPLLRDYVRQGGQLVIVAGEAMNPTRWTEVAWLDGQGILPAPLAAEPIGRTLEELGDSPRLFRIHYGSVQNHALFRLADESDQYLADLYTGPIFYKALVAEVNNDAREKIERSELDRLKKELAAAGDLLARIKRAREQEAKGLLADEGQTQLKQDEAELAKLRPDWLLWARGQGRDPLADLPADAAARDKALLELARQSTPVVLARFDHESNAPYLVLRSIGRGRALLVTSGMLQNWNSLSNMEAVLVFIRLLQGMIESTLPQRTFAEVDQIALPLASYDPQIHYSLARPLPVDQRSATRSQNSAGAAGDAKATSPGGKRERSPLANAETEALDVGFIGAETRGLTLRSTLQRGIYRVTGMRGEPALSSSDPQSELQPETVYESLVAVNGPAEESELRYLSDAQFQARAGGSPAQWVPPGATISLSGLAGKSQDLWWYVTLAVLVALLVELLILAWPAATEPSLQPAGA